jgi:hypothetical protein
MVGNKFDNAGIALSGMGKGIDYPATPHIFATPTKDIRHTICI